MENSKTANARFLKTKNPHEVTQKWIDSITSDCDETETSYDGEESSIISSISDQDYNGEDGGDIINIKDLGTQIAPHDLLSLKKVLNTLNCVQHIENVTIENSTGVHIGNVTNINGNIQIIHTGDDARHKSPVFQRKFVQPSGIEEQVERNSSEAFLDRTSKLKQFSPSGIEEQVERNSSDAFLDRTKFKIPRGLCAFISRTTWLAQRPLAEYSYMEEPVRYVIIAHTATESSEKQAMNIGLVRHIQCFHIETRGWNDISYNFLVGCDGNIYQGRGWGVVGAHTLGYNTISMGIAFIGCFMRDLPSVAAITACKNLLKIGVDEGHLAKDYRLITHSQCRSTESPGRKLIEELQTWDHFYKIEEEEEELKM